MDSIGPYKIERLVAQGHSSVVYSATDRHLGRRVAIKVAEPGLDPYDISRFAQEHKILLSLRHRSIVSVYDIGKLPDGTPYFVMEWVNGRRLDDILRSHEPLPVPVALNIAEQVASGLGAAHAHGVLHADVKPANIFVENIESPSAVTVKLLDFHVARELSEDGDRTLSGTMSGTPLYMAPEQIRGQSLAPSADVWGLGIVIYEMLTGNLPFRGDSIPEMLAAIISGRVLVPKGNNIPRSVAAFVNRCLDPDSTHRPISGNEAAKEIKNLLKRAAADGRRTDPWLTEYALITAVVLVGLFALTFLLVRYKHSTPAAIVGVLLGLCLAIGGITFGHVLRKYLSRRGRKASYEARHLLASAKNRQQLSEDLTTQIDELISKCRQIDEKILAMTMAVMVEEFGKAKISDDRQKALMNAVTLLEKLMAKLSPWYVRHDQLIVSLVSVLGLLSGLTTAALNIVKLVKGR